MSLPQTDPKASSWLTKVQRCLEKLDKQELGCIYVPAEI